MRHFQQCLDAAAQVDGFKGKFLQASDSWLVEQGVNYWAGERSLPLWLPAEDQNKLNRACALSATMPLPIERVLSDVLEDEKHRGRSRKRHSGMSRNFERPLITKHRNSWGIRA